MEQASSEPQLGGQRVLVIGGSSGHRARDSPARPAPRRPTWTLTARAPDRLHRVGHELGAAVAAFDALGLRPPPAASSTSQPDADRPRPRHGAQAPTTRTAGAEFDFEAASPRPRRPTSGCRSTSPRRARGARFAAGGTPPVHRRHRRPSLVRLGLAVDLGDHGRDARPRAELWRSSSRPSASTSSRPGSSTPPCRRRLLGDHLDARREQLRATLPIGRVVGPADIAALALHLMTNTAVTRSDLRHRRRPAARGRVIDVSDALDRLHRLRHRGQLRRRGWPHTRAGGWPSPRRDQGRRSVVRRRGQAAGRYQFVAQPPACLAARPWGSSTHSVRASTDGPSATVSSCRWERARSPTTRSSRRRS